MTEREWIDRLKHQIEMLEENARGQRQFAEEHQKTLPVAKAKTLNFADSLESWAKQTREHLRRFEEEHSAP